MKPKQLLYLLLFLLCGVACQKDTVTHIDTDKEFVVNFDFPSGDVFAPSKVVITNRTKNALEYQWSYDEVRVISGTDTVLSKSSTGLLPDTFYFEVPGTYSVTLTAKSAGATETVTKQLVVKKSPPVILLPENVAIMNDAQFRASVFKYPDQAVTYQWDFGDGNTSTDPEPIHVYEDEGTYTVTLVINDGQETLSTSADLVVKGEIAKTLYVTDMRTKQLFKYRFTQLKPSTPVGLPVNVGIHPLSVNIYGEKVIISDAGVGVTFTSATSDGRLFAFDLNGQNEVTITQPPAGSAYGDDPFCSTVDESGMIHFLTRFGGLRSISSTSVDAPYPAVRITVTAAQAGVSSTFGWLDGNIQIVNGEIWYSKHGSAGKGLYRYSTSGAFLGIVPGLAEAKIRSFAVDTKHGKIYFMINFVGGGFNKGVYRCDMNGTNLELIDELAGFSTEGGENEWTAVTQMVIDDNPDDGSAGYLYYPFRAATDINASGTVTGNGSASGVKRYPLDGSAAPSFFLNGFIPYGIAIDHVKR